MTRRSFLQVPLAAVGGKPPNVLLILTDDQGWFDLGVHGNPHIETPNLDRLASESVRFSHFHASPVCSPTRAALLTGRHYQRTGCIDTYMGRDVLRSNEITLGDAFQRAGYRTACIGKWHLGRYMRYHPNQRGFEEFFGFWQYGFIHHYDDPDDLFHNRRSVSATGYITDVFTERAIDFIRSAGSRPWFLYLAYNAPHSPHLAPDAYIERYLKKGLPLREARIYAMITAIDDNIVKLLQALDAANTVVLFMTDNGGVSRYHKCGLRGQKGSVWEGGVRVPLFARWPGRFPPGKVIPSMAQHIDVFPTLCELIGAPLPQDRHLDGRSLLPLLRAGRGASSHQYLFHQWQRVRPAPESGAVRDSRGYKLHIGSGALYDLNNDPGEERDLAARHPALARSLRDEFDRWFADVTGGQDYSRAPIEIGRPDENPVEIDLTWGEPVGRRVLPTYRNYNRDIIDRWTEAGDVVRWKLDVVEAGRYEVTLTYGCRPADAGSRLALTVGPARLEHTVLPTVGREVFEPRRAGHLDLPKGQATLEIRPLAITGAELMALHKIWFRRI